MICLLHKHKQKQINDIFFFITVRRQKELSTLFEKIAKEYPDLANQGLYNGKKLTLDNLFGLTVFGQPRMGKK